MSASEAFNYVIKELTVAGITLSDNTDKYIYVENLYSARTIANMYLALHVPEQTYYAIVAAEGGENGFVNIVLGVRNALSSTSTSSNVIEGKFSYLVSNDNLNKTAFFTDTEGYSQDMTYKSIYLSVIWEEALDNMKTSISGTYYMISIHEVIKLILSGFKNIVVQTPNVEFENVDSIGTSVNKTEATNKLEDKEKRGQYLNPEEKEIPGDVFEQLVLPPITNRRKLLEYVFNLKPFYKTAYTFFCDFANTYLIAHDIESTTIGEIDTIVFHITEVLDDYAYIEGMATPTKSKKKKKRGKKKGSYIEGSNYHIYIDPADVNVSPAKGMDKISTTFMSVTESGMVSEPYELAGAVSSGENSKLSIHQGNYPELYVNILNSSTIYLEFTKAYINSSVITPDKNIIVEFADHDMQEKHGGNYYMSYKTEIIRNNQGNFMCSAAFGMYKIGELKDFSVGNKSSFRNQESGSGTKSTKSISTKKTASNVKKGSRGAGANKKATSARVTAPTLNRSAYASEVKLGFQGPVMVDRRSSGPTVFNNPHTYEPGIKK